MRERSKQLIGLIGLIGSVGLIITATVAAHPTSNVQYTGYVKHAGSPKIRHTLTIERNGNKARVSDFLTRCGELSSGTVAVRHNSFSYDRTFSNGYGLKALVHLSWPRAKGTIEAWSPRHHCDTGKLSFSIPRTYP